MNLVKLGRTIKGVLTQGAIGREFKEIKEFREALSKGYKWSKGYKGMLSHKHKKDRGKTSVAAKLLKRRALDSKRRALAQARGDTL